MSSMSCDSLLHRGNTMSEYLWKKQDLESAITQVEKKRRVLVLYTGGTIGMKWTERGNIYSKERVYPLSL